MMDLEKINGLKRLICFGFILIISTAFAKQLPDKKPDTFLLNAEVLQSNKTKIKKGDKILIKALNELVNNADKTLTKGPYSVTYKSKIPPSGDKHDYMSVGPYWWPDSSKADGLPYIRKDGQVNPERFTIKDAEFHGAMCEDIHILGLAWFFTHDEKYASHAAKLLKVWFLDESTKMNPNLNFGQAIPGRMNGRGIGIIDTRNLGKLIDGIQLLKGSKSLPDSDYKAIQNWYKEFLNWMQTSPIGLDEADEFNNHGTWYDVQVVSMALFTGKKDLAKKILEEQTKKRIDSQLKADGSQPHELARTLSWNYSTMNLKGFLELASLADHVGIDLWNYMSPEGKSIKSAFKWMLPYAEKKKAWESKQIKEIHYEDFAELAGMVVKKYPDLDLKPLIKANKVEENSIVMLTGNY